MALFKTLYVQLFLFSGVQLNNDLQKSNASWSFRGYFKGVHTKLEATICI